MSYNPKSEGKYILDRAMFWINSVPYEVTARWVFYRLLQEGTYNEKAGYRHLLALTSKARKNFYADWRPWTLADDTRTPVLMQRTGYYGLHLRGSGFENEREWLNTLKEEITCPLNRWTGQKVYSELYFEAHAMQGQFLHYANENLPLLAFGGDVSIAAKWKTAQRLAERFKELNKPIHIFYFGDYDEKGLMIPESAWHDIYSWTAALIVKMGVDRSEIPNRLHLHRIGINEDQIESMNLPENPERPGTYQWEALNDDQAEELINQANGYLDLQAFEQVQDEEREITAMLKDKLKDI